MIGELSLQLIRDVEGVEFSGVLIDDAHWEAPLHRIMSMEQAKNDYTRPSWPFKPADHPSSTASICRAGFGAITRKLRELTMFANRGSLFWHQRNDTVPAQRWLRETLVDLFARME
ncbi:hypothetical protein J6500_16745 [Bradyrhizobium sp. WSM 1704]|uniref:hypothetical protein n=1 Tax=Bradyrhizobium semiaridum TaxID=2821404 RepID=UPI001CE2C06F|nr:hypothetical protein [Bradyrhizobium semiaridum]MCA6123531.1 hypothetical protein [Bradyrhizobium semiaridum]